MSSSTLPDTKRLRALTVTLVDRGELPAFYRAPRRQLMLERQLQRALGPLLGDLLSGLLAGLDDGSVRPGLVAQVEAALADGATAIGEGITAALVNGELASAKWGFERMAALLRPQGIDLSWELFEPRARAILVEQGAAASKLITDRVVRDARNILVKGLEEGIGEREIAGNLRGLERDLRRHQAESIARTEIHSAVEEGNFQALDGGNVEYIQWITAADSRVRDTHMALHGMVVRRGERFANGLLFPGDRNGTDPGEFISCRCAQTPYFPLASESALGTPFVGRA